MTAPSVMIAASTLGGGGRIGAGAMTTGEAGGEDSCTCGETGCGAEHSTHYEDTRDSREDKRTRNDLDVIIELAQIIIGFIAVDQCVRGRRRTCMLQYLLLPLVFLCQSSGMESKES